MACEINEKDAAMLEYISKLGEGMRCETCAFYSPVQTVTYGDGKGWDVRSWDEYGRCHRFPPKEVGPSSYTKVAFPSVAHDDWCGEHKERDAS